MLFDVVRIMLFKHSGDCKIIVLSYFFCNELNWSMIRSISFLCNCDSVNTGSELFLEY